MRVRVGDRYIERPFRELALEALASPFLWFIFNHALCGGWSH